MLIEEFKGKTSRMTWDSLPGKDGFRLSWKKGAESGTLDIVPGIGIVGMDLDVSFERWCSVEVVETGGIQISARIGKNNMMAKP